MLQHPPRLQACLLLALGCAEPPEAAPTLTPCVRAAAVPTVATMAWEASTGQHHVEVYLDGQRVLQSPTVGGSDPELLVLGMKTQRDYELVAVSVRPDGTRLESAPTAFRTGPLPAELPPYTLLHVDPERSEMAQGYLLLNQFDRLRTGSFATVLDGEAEHVWFVQDDGWPLKINRARVALDGGGMLVSTYHWDRERDLGTITRRAWDGTTVSTTRALQQHHDFLEHTDGTLSWLSFVFDDLEFGDFQAHIASDAIRTAPEGTTDAADDRIYDLLTDHPAEPQVTCEHMLQPGWAPEQAFEWTHSNSLIASGDDRAIYVMVRYLDALLKIDRASGDLIWQLGGPHATLGDAEPEELFHHGHASHAWDGGVLVFDNADHTADEHSRVVELAIDEAARTAEVVWEHPEPDGAFVSVLGDARRLPGGNTLIAWSTRGRIDEVTPEGEVVWSAQTSHALGRMEWLPSLPP